MNRRGFLAGILAAGVSPWVMPGGVASGVLMPARQIWKPAGLDLLDSCGRVLCSLYYPDKKLNVPVQALVINSGTFAKAILQHSTYGPIFVNGLEFPSSDLVFGSTMHMSLLSIIDL